MLVGMGLGAVPMRIMLVLMMLIVGMDVRVSERFVNMFVLVILGQVQPNTHCHTGCCDPERPARRLTVERDRQRASNEGRGREIGASTGGAQISQREDEEHQTESVAEETQDQRRAERLPSWKMLLQYPGDYNVRTAGCQTLNCRDDAGVAT